MCNLCTHIDVNVWLLLLGEMGMELTHLYAIFFNVGTDIAVLFLQLEYFQC